MLSKIPGCILAAMLTLLTACGSSSPASNTDPAAQAQVLGTAAVSAPSACELAAYPSLQWTQCETQNVLVPLENVVPDSAMEPQITAATLAYQAARLQVLRTDPERQPNPNSCTAVVLCPIDPRLQNWADGSGIVATALYTSRSGATMSSHIWATKNGPAKRPGIVIINGSIIGYEQAYWYAAQALAKAGFVVMTFDTQGEGMSDQFGQAPDQLEDAFAGIPVLGVFGPPPPTGLGLGGNGLPFYDGGEDALDFFLSTPANPYVPVPSRSTATSHNAKQQSRVAAGLDNAYKQVTSVATATLSLCDQHSAAVQQMLDTETDSADILGQIRRSPGHANRALLQKSLQRRNQTSANRKLNGNSKPRIKVRKIPVAFIFWQAPADGPAFAAMLVDFGIAKATRRIDAG